MAISKLAAVKTSSFAQAEPLFRPVPKPQISHQEIGIKQEDDKTYLDHRSPNIFPHGKTTPWLWID
jgi:hypothetical protein